MRKLVTLLAFLVLANCTPAAENSGDGTNTPTGNEEIRIKTLNGDFDSIKINNVTQLKVSVSDSTGATTVVKAYFLPESATRTQDLGLSTPGQKNTGNLKKTGTVDVQYILEGTTMEFTRRFDILNNQYLQDTIFNDVIYTTDEKITFDWLDK